MFRWVPGTTVFHLADHGVSLVGVLPKGFPPFTIPSVHLADLGPLFAGALGIALVSLADTISTASAFAARTGQEVNGNGEMIGIGRTINPHHFFPTIAAAIAAFRDETGAQWIGDGRLPDSQAAPGQAAADGTPSPDVPAAPPIG